MATKHIVKSSCPLNCWDSCGFNVTIEHDQVSKVDGDPDHPITKGKICGRGRKLAIRTNDTSRVVHPLKKINGQFKQITWSQALDEIAEKMDTIKKYDGTTAVMHSHDYANNGLLKYLDARFFNAYGGVTEVVGSLCWGAGIEAQTLDFGNVYSHSPEDIRHSQNIIIWGRNPARTNIHLFSEIQAAKKRGVPIIDINPIYNAVSKLADLHVKVKPGTDGILALGIIKEILRLKKEDKQFIKYHSHGFMDLRETLRQLSFNDIETITDVSCETLSLLAQYYINGPTSTHLGLGMQRYENGGDTIRSIDALVAMSGNIGIPGGGANYANLAVGQSIQTDALSCSELRTAQRTFTRMNQAEQMIMANNPKIKMLFISRSNPLTQLPDTNKVKKAFNTIETKIVIDQYMTDTAAMADYVLPCTTVFEEEDIYFSSMYHHYLNYGPALVTQAGEAKSDLYIWTELAKRLGYGDVFAYSRDEFFEMALVNLNKHNITLEKIKTEKRVALPVSPVPWHDYQFQTPSGKYEFTSLKAKSKGEDGKIRISYPKESVQNTPERAKKFPYRLISMHPLRSNHSQHYQWHSKDKENNVEISQEISTTLNLKNGDWVEVFNDRGTIHGKVSVLKEAHPTTINIDEGHWEAFGGTVNYLTSSSQSTIGFGSILYDCLVNIKKI